MYNTSENYSKPAINDKVVPFIVEGEFYFSLGVKAFRKRNFDTALKRMEQAVELSPKNPLFLSQLSVLYTETGSYHKANQILNQVIKEFGDEYVDCYYLISNNYAHLGLFNDALHYAQQYLEVSPDGEFKTEASNLLEVLEMYQEEEEEDDLLFEDEDELMIHQETTFYHLERQEWDVVLPLLEEMMTLFPEHKPAKHDFAYALFFNGDRDEAIELEKQWLEMEPNSIQSRSNLAIFYHEMGDYETSQSHIHVLKAVYPIHEQQKLKLAVTFAQTGNYKIAIDRFKLLPKGKLKGHSAYFKWFSLAANRMGDHDKAETLWNEGCKQHPFLKTHDIPWLPQNV